MSLLLLFKTSGAPPLLDTCPAIVSTSSGASASELTEHTLDLPAGIAVGDFLAAFVQCHGASNEATIGGWNQIIIGQTLAGALCLLWRIADGSEGSYAELELASGAHIAYVVHAIAGVETWDEGYVAADANSNEPNPPSHSPAGGSGQILWLAVSGWTDDFSNTDWPSGFLVARTTARVAASNGVGIAVAGKNVSAASQDPGPFGLSGATFWIAATLAFYCQVNELATGMAVETDTAFALAPTKIKPIGRADETDSAIALPGTKIRAVGMAVETDTAFALQISMPNDLMVGAATETDTAFALARKKIKPIGLAAETNAAYALVVGRMYHYGIAVETDSAFALGKKKTKAIGVAIETDIALNPPISSGHTIPVGIAVETDSAFALGRIKIRDVKRANETDTAFALSFGATELQVGVAVETDSCPTTFTLTKRITYGMAVETDTAFRLLNRSAGGGGGGKHNKCCCPSCLICEDDFNRADSSNLGAGWSEIYGEWIINSNALLCVYEGPVITTCIQRPPSRGTVYNSRVVVDLTDFPSVGTKTWKVITRYESSTTFKWIQLDYDSSTGQLFPKFYSRSGGSDTLVMDITTHPAGEPWSVTPGSSAFRMEFCNSNVQWSVTPFSEQQDVYWETTGGGAASLPGGGLGQVGFLAGSFDNFSFLIHWESQLSCERCWCFCLNANDDDDYVAIPETLYLAVTPDTSYVCDEVDTLEVALYQSLPDVSGADPIFDLNPQKKYWYSDTFTIEAEKMWFVLSCLGDEPTRLAVLTYPAIDPTGAPANTLFMTQSIRDGGATTCNPLVLVFRSLTTGTQTCDLDPDDPGFPGTGTRPAACTSGDCLPVPLTNPITWTVTITD